MRLRRDSEEIRFVSLFCDVQVSLFVAGALFGDVQVSLFVAGAVFGEVEVSLFVVGAYSVKFGMIAGARNVVFFNAKCSWWS